MRLTHTSALCVTFCITGLINSFDEGDERCTLHNIRIILADLLGLDRDVFKAKPWKKFIKQRVLLHMKARLGLCSPFQASFSDPYMSVEDTLCTLNQPGPGSSAYRRSTNSPSTGSELTPDPSDHSFRPATTCRAQSSPTVSIPIPPCSRVIKNESTESNSTDLLEPTSSALSRPTIRPLIQRNKCSEPPDRDLDRDLDTWIPIKRTEAQVNNIIMDICRRMEKRNSKSMTARPEEDHREDIKIKRELRKSNRISESNHDYESSDGDDDEDIEGCDQDSTFSPTKTRLEKRKLQDTLFLEEQDQKRLIKTQWTSETQRPKTRTCTTQEEIKRLKRLISGAGIRKRWTKEFKGRELDLKWQLCHLQTILHGIRTRQPPYTVRTYRKLRSLELAARKAERRDILSELEGEVFGGSTSELSLASRASLAGTEKAKNVKTWRGWRYIMVDDEGNELPDAIWEAPTKQTNNEHET